MANIDLLFKEIPIAPRVLTENTNFNLVENQVVNVVGQGTVIPPDVDRALEENSREAYIIERGSQLWENILVVAQQVVEDISVFSELRNKDSDNQLTQIQSAIKFIDELLSKGKEIVVICPYLIKTPTKHRVASRFRAIVPEVNLDILYDRKAINAVIGDWKEFSKHNNEDEQMFYLQAFAEKACDVGGYGWDGLAITLGYFSGISYEKLSSLAVTKKSTAFLEEIYPMTFKLDSYREVERVVKVFIGIFEASIFSRDINYNVPTVYGIDFGSLVREWMDGKTIEELSLERVEAILARAGGLMKYRPIDVFSKELPRVPYSENLFNHLLPSEVIEKIKNFIFGHEFDKEVRAELRYKKSHPKLVVA